MRPPFRVHTLVEALLAASAVSIVATTHACGGQGNPGSAGDASAGEASPDASPYPTPDGSAEADGPTPPITQVACDVLVVGGTLGAAIAAITAADRGVHVCLAEPSSWLGGQMTAQGVSTFDGAGFLTANLPFAPAILLEIRSALLQHYDAPPLLPILPEAGLASFSPGSFADNGPNAYEAAVAAAVFDAMASKRASLSAYRGVHPIAVDKAGMRIGGATVADDSGVQTHFTASITIDASPWGDLLPLAGAAYRTGAEPKSDTGEPMAPDVGDPECVQPMTSVFFFEWFPDGTDVSMKTPPPGYDPSHYASSVPPTTTILPPVEPEPGDAGFTFWTYRRSLYRFQFSSGVAQDVAQINWDDFNHDCLEGVSGGVDGGAGCNVIDKDPATRAAILTRSRDVALGFAYYVQHDLPRNDGRGNGYPNLKLRPDEVGTTDGLSQLPYVRESRRIRALTTIREQDLQNDFLPPGNVRGTLFDDGLAEIGGPLDVHMCAPFDQAPFGVPPYGCGAQDCGPYYAQGSKTEVPLGALVPESLDGLLAGSLDLGATHLSNANLRLHTSELAIGIASGEAAAYAAQTQTSLRAVRTNPAALRALQWRIVQAGDPILTFRDLPNSDPLWPSAELAAVVGAFDAFVSTTANLLPATAVTRGELAVGVVRATDLKPVAGSAEGGTCAETPAFPMDVSCSDPFFPYVQALADIHATSGCAPQKYCRDNDAIREFFASVLAIADCGGAAGCPPQATTATFTDVPASSPFYDAIEELAGWGVFDGDPGVTTSGTGKSFNPTNTVTRETVARWIAAYTRHRFGL